MGELCFRLSISAVVVLRMKASNREQNAETTRVKTMTRINEVILSCTSQLVQGGRHSHLIDRIAGDGVSLIGQV